jgi:hypothetical protein
MKGFSSLSKLSCKQEDQKRFKGANILSKHLNKNIKVYESQIRIGLPCNIFHSRYLKVQTYDIVTDKLGVAFGRQLEKEEFIVANKDSPLLILCRLG